MHSFRLLSAINNSGLNALFNMHTNISFSYAFRLCNGNINNYMYINIYCNETINIVHVNNIKKCTLTVPYLEIIVKLYYFVLFCRHKETQEREKIDQQLELLKRQVEELTRGKEDSLLQKYDQFNIYCRK